MNGTFVAANLSVDTTMGGADGGAADACLVGISVGVGTTAATDGDGVAGVGVGVAAASFDPLAISILVKYRKPPTPIATRQTTNTTAGHSQFAPAAGFAAGFLTCGVA